MNIIGLDISSTNTGVAICENGQITFVKNIKRRKGETIDEYLLDFEQALENLILHIHPRIASIEAPFAGRNIKSLETLCFVHGVARLLCQKWKIKPIYYSPQEIKKAVLGKITLLKDNGEKKTGKELKQEVADVVCDHYRVLPSIGDDNITDAIATIYCYEKKGEK